MLELYLDFDPKTDAYIECNGEICIWQDNDRNCEGSPERKIWKTKHGECICVKDMTTAHIKNCLKFCNTYNNDA